MVTVTSVEAQNHFGKLLDTAQREPVVITRHGRVAAFMVSPQDMDALEISRSRRESDADAFEALFARTDPKLSAAAADLTDEDVFDMVHEEG